MWFIPIWNCLNIYAPPCGNVSTMSHLSWMRVASRKEVGEYRLLPSIFLPCCFPKFEMIFRPLLYFQLLLLHSLLIPKRQARCRYLEWSLSCCFLCFSFLELAVNLVPFPFCKPYQTSLHYGPIKEPLFRVDSKRHHNGHGSISFPAEAQRTGGAGNVPSLICYRASDVLAGELLFEAKRCAFQLHI